MKPNTAGLPFPFCFLPCLRTGILSLRTVILKWPGRGETPRPTHPVYIWNIPIIPSTRLGGRLLLLYHGDAERHFETPNLVRILKFSAEIPQTGLLFTPRRDRPAIHGYLVFIIKRTDHFYGVRGGITSRPAGGIRAKDHPVLQLWSTLTHGRGGKAYT